MLYTIANEWLRVQICDLGAELWSIQTADGTEALWQGDPAYWDHRAWNLFPFVGLCFGKTYWHEGRPYPMEEHGFLKDMVLRVLHKTDTSICFVCIDTEATRQNYPFSFRYEIAYGLEGTRLQVEIRVENTGSTAMYCAVGAHPGFQVPLEDGYIYEDYELLFAPAARLKAAPCTCRPCYLKGPFAPYPLQEQRLPLTHALFAEHMLILRDTGGVVTLRTPGGKRKITVEYPDMDYLGIWKCIGSEAPYVCLEPWSALPDFLDDRRELSQKADMTCLASGGEAIWRWAVSVTT